MQLKGSFTVLEPTKAPLLQSWQLCLINAGGAFVRQYVDVILLY